MGRSAWPCGWVVEDIIDVVLATKEKMATQAGAYTR
jgi:hypothetical protein